ncbi:MAG: hypothetical protein ACOX4Q_15880 [Syntrophomonadales bacterium]
MRRFLPQGYDRQVPNEEGHLFEGPACRGRDVGIVEADAGIKEGTKLLNYFNEMTAFYEQDWPNRLNSSSSMLYMLLLHMGNKLFWEEGFEVSSKVLRAKAGISDRKTLDRARALLVEKGLILYTPTQPAKGLGKYTIVGLASPKGGPRRRMPNSGKDDHCRSSHESCDEAAPDLENTDTSAVGPNPGDKSPYSYPGAEAGDVLWNKSPVVSLYPGNNSPHGDRTNAPKPRFGVGSRPSIKKQNYKHTKHSSANANETSDDSVSSRELIRELVQNFRSIEGITSAKGDYPFIGCLYNEFGFEGVLSAIHELAMAAATAKIEKPLIYLKSILVKRRSGFYGTGFISYAAQLREEVDPVERYRYDRYEG